MRIYLIILLVRRNIDYIPLGIAFDGFNMWVIGEKLDQNPNVTILPRETIGTVIKGTVGNRLKGIAFDHTHMWVIDDFSEPGKVFKIKKRNH